MPLGIELGLSPGDDEDPAPSPKRGEAPIFGPRLLWPKAALIKMPLGMEVGLGLSDIVLDGDAAPLPKGTQPPIFGQCPLWPTAVWTEMPLGMEASLGPGDCVRWGPVASRKKRTQPPNPIFCPCLLWPNGGVDQDATWYRGKRRLRRRCVRWGRSSP